MPASADQDFDARPYYAVVLSDDRANSFRSISSLSNNIRQVSKLSLGREWEVTDAELTSTIPFAISGSRRNRQQRSGGLYGHKLVHAAPAGKHRSWALVASPYIRVLTQLHAEITQDDQAAIKYLKFDMVDIYGRLELEASLRCHQVEVQMASSVDVETIILAGKKPLDSRIHRMIKDETIPFGARIATRREVDGRQPAAVSIERFGNLRWYVSAEERLLCGLLVVQDLIDQGFSDETAEFPGRRVDPEQQR